MGKRYAAFDVETPNSQNNRMSAIGISLIEDGAVTDEFYSLVNPETYFNSFNIELTGITPEAAERAPDFYGIWQQIEPFLNGSILVAHNAPFDMGVLAKCLRAYSIDWLDTALYACTCKMSRACYPTLPNHKLDTVCAYLDLELDHHNAGSDSRACAEIFLDCAYRVSDVGRFIKKFSMYDMRTI